MSEPLSNHAERAHTLLSPSSSSRWLVCTPSARASLLYRDTDTKSTIGGTLAHKTAEEYARGGSFALGEVPEGVTGEMIECAMAYRDYIAEQVPEDAVTLFEERVDFSEWVPEGFGTCDCLSIYGDTLTIIDYKYGQGVKVSAVGNTQMRLYALGAMHDYGFIYDVKRVKMCIFQPRINNISTDEISVSDLLRWAKKVVVPRAKKAFEGKGKYEPGEHCQFCPHAGHCLALYKSCMGYVTAYGMTSPVESANPWEIANVLKIEPLISLWLRRVKEAATADLLDGKPVQGYKLVAGKQGNRKWSDETAVANALMSAGYTADEIIRAEILSPAELDRAIGKKKAAELTAEYVTRDSGAPTIAPEDDPRPVFDRVAEAKKDFEN